MQKISFRTAALGTCLFLSQQVHLLSASFFVPGLALGSTLCVYPKDAVLVQGGVEVSDRLVMVPKKGYNSCSSLTEYTADPPELNRARFGERVS